MCLFFQVSLCDLLVGVISESADEEAVIGADVVLPSVQNRENIYYRIENLLTTAHCLLNVTK